MSMTTPEAPDCAAIGLIGSATSTSTDYSAALQLSGTTNLQKRKGIMDAIKINQALRDAGTSQSAIADALHVSKTSVSLVVAGKSSSQKIQAAIEAATNLPARTLWPLKISRLDRAANSRVVARQAVARMSGAA